MNEADASALVREVEAAWNTHDMARFAACFAPDADFVNVGGVWWKGRREIEQAHRASHAGTFRESVLKRKLAAFKEVGPGIGVAHVNWQLEGHGKSGPRRTTAVRLGIWPWTPRDRGGALENRGRAEYGRPRPARRADGIGLTRMTRSTRPGGLRPTQASREFSCVHRPSGWRSGSGEVAFLQAASWGKRG